MFIYAKSRIFFSGFSFCFVGLQGNDERLQILFFCRKLLMELAATNIVCLIWVPGHSDIKGNEMADELALQGSDSPFVGPEPALPIKIGNRQRSPSPAH